ncbi:MAG: zinc dependent phospholipase C family protein [Oscillibacter sp.]
MQKRSHKLLAASLLESENGFDARRFELAFLFGSFQPDCNPFSYLKGSVRSYKLRGHNYTNSQNYINRHIDRLQNRSRWTMWQYYTLGKLTHYLADAFTYPHNENYADSMLSHHQYETDLRDYLTQYLSQRDLLRQHAALDLNAAITDLHAQYMDTVASIREDVQYILEATELLMAGCLPQSANTPQPASAC